MLNKKGFTIAEVIVSFSLISVVLFSLISTTMYYRDKVKDEEIKSQLWDYKNTVTKVIYDDIINKEIVSAASCFGNGEDDGGAGAGTCIHLYDKNNEKHTLMINEIKNANNIYDNNQGVYLTYDGTRYKLPDSDLGAWTKETDKNTGAETLIYTPNKRICDFVGEFQISSYNNEIFKIKIPFYHKDLNIHNDISFVIY